MFKVLLEEPNGLARRIVSKAGSNASRLLDKTEAFLKQQGRTSGDSAQVDSFPPCPDCQATIQILEKKKEYIWTLKASYHWPQRGHASP